MASRPEEAALTNKVASSAMAEDPETAAVRRLATPPPPSERGRVTDSKHNIEANSHRRTRSNVSAHEELRRGGIDHALLRELGRPHRESTPSASPHRKRQRINGDR